MSDHDLGGGVRNESVNIKMKSWQSHLHGTPRRSPTGIAVTTAINIKGGGGRWERLVFFLSDKASHI